MVAMEKEITGLCSESVFSSSFQIGFGLIARRIVLHSHTSQTNLDNMACGVIKDKKPVFSVCIGYSVMVNTFLSITRAVGGFCRPSGGLLLWWMFWTGVFMWVLWGMASLAFFSFLTGGAEFMFQG